VKSGFNCKSEINIFTYTGSLWHSIVTELENNQQKFRIGWCGRTAFLLPLKFGHYSANERKNFSYPINAYQT